MGDFLGNAVSGMLSFQRALSTTSHNIANVNTPGYSRQSVELDARNPVPMGGTFVGSGVEISAIQRAYDQFGTDSLRLSTSSYAALEKFTDLAGQIDNLLADPQGGLTPILQEFFSSVQGVADDPSSGSARRQLLSIAESMVNRFRAFDTRLESLRKTAETDLTTMVNEINSLAQAIADINISLEEINASGNLSQQSSDLLDKRDALLLELSERVGIQVINEPGNLITVQIGNGQTVVTGGTAFTLGTQPTPGDPLRNQIVYSSFTSVSDITSNLTGTGGKLGGLLDYRDQLLEPTLNSLGRIAITLADSFNQQHREGMDLLDTLGVDFFSFDPPTTIVFTGNTGAATVSATISDLSQLTIDDYLVEFNAGVWTITSDSGSSSTLTPPSDTFEGLTINIAGAAANGDRFTIKPTAAGARTIDVAISDPNRIAAASGIRAQSSLSNLGDVGISQGVVTDATNANLLDTVAIRFNTPATTFDVIDVATSGVIAAGVGYTNGMSVAYNGWQVELEGLNPQAGDEFTIEANFGGRGDNRNMLELSRLQTTGILDSGVNNYQEAYSVLVGRVGSVSAAAEIDRDAQLTLKLQAEDRVAQIAGVNLDEEAADLIKYQQAYEAAARVISTAQTLFNTLIEVTR